MEGRNVFYLLFIYHEIMLTEMTEYVHQDCREIQALMHFVAAN